MFFFLLHFKILESIFLLLFNIFIGGWHTDGELVKRETINSQTGVESLSAVFQNSEKLKYTKLVSKLQEIEGVKEPTAKLHVRKYLDAGHLSKNGNIYSINNFL